MSNTQTYSPCGVLSRGHNSWYGRHREVTHTVSSKIVRGIYQQSVCVIFFTLWIIKVGKQEREREKRERVWETLRRTQERETIKMRRHVRGSLPLTLHLFIYFLEISLANIFTPVLAPQRAQTRTKYGQNTQIHRHGEGEGETHTNTWRQICEESRDNKAEEILE